MRAAAAAASQPAWPPPITTTSNRLHISRLGWRVVAETRRGVKNIGFRGNVSRETLSTRWFGLAKGILGGVLDMFETHENSRQPWVGAAEAGSITAHMSICCLFANAIIPENHVQDILDINPPGYRRNRTAACPHLFG